MDTGNCHARKVGHSVLLEFRGEGLCGGLGWPPQDRGGGGTKCTEVEVICFFLTGTCNVYSLGNLPSNNIDLSSWRMY